jgi:hypothetical protein
VRRPEDGESQEGVEYEAFRVWFHAKHSESALHSSREGKRPRVISHDEAWEGWRAQYLWQADGQPIKKLISARDWMTVGAWTVMGLILIFGHYD